MWMLPLYLHVNQKSDYADMMMMMMIMMKHVFIFIFHSLNIPKHSFIYINPFYLH